jgi:hypothetical protein
VRQIASEKATMPGSAHYPFHNQAERKPVFDQYQSRPLDIVGMSKHAYMRPNLGIGNPWRHLPALVWDSQEPRTTRSSALCLPLRQVSPLWTFYLPL